MKPALLRWRRIERVHRIFRRLRSPEQETLCVNKTQILKALELIFGLDAFRHNIDAHFFAQQADQIHDVLDVATVSKLPHETLINLDAVKRKTVQMA